MNKKTFKQFHAVLMTYYTRPLMWVAALSLFVIFFIVFPDFYSINSIKNIKELDTQDLITEISAIILFRNIILLVGIYVIFIQINTQFGSYQSRLLPTYKNIHLVIAGGGIFLITLGIALSFLPLAIPLLQSVGMCFGFLSFYLCLLINRKLYIETISVFWITHFSIILLPTLVKLNEKAYSFLSRSFQWYLFESSYQFLIPMITGCIIYYFIGQQISSSATYSDLKESKINLTSYSQWSESLNNKRENYYDYLSVILNRRLFKANYLDKNQDSERLMLWKHAIPKDALEAVLILSS